MKLLSIHYANRTVGWSTKVTTDLRRNTYNSVNVWLLPDTFSRQLSYTNRAHIREVLRIEDSKSN